MKALLLHPDRDFYMHESLSSDNRYRRQELDRNTRLRATVLWNAPELIQDLELSTLLRAMASGDEFVFDVSEHALLSGLQNNLETVLYRQSVLRDCLHNAAVIRRLFRLLTTVEAEVRRSWWGLSSEYPGTLLYSSIELMETYVGVLKELRTVARENAASFTSKGFTSLFSTLKEELTEEYLSTIKGHLSQLKFPGGVLLSAGLGENNEGTNYVLRHARGKQASWLDRLLGRAAPAYTFRLAGPDEAGGKILTEIRNRGISRVALALAASADHVMAFFKMLRTELAFYLGCVNLHDNLSARGMPLVFPDPRPAGDRRHEFSGLYDVCLALTKPGVIGNTVSDNGKSLVIITGANQGGKSTFLRSIGLAQIMMQSGMFVGAESFRAETCPALFTHFKREEDRTMKSGKFDEELARMSAITDHVVPNSILLLNESFAATNEREGSEIARQIVQALLERGMKVFYVTHLYQFAHGFQDQGEEALFLRAERKDDGSRTFRLVEADPLHTSYGEDLYYEVFEN